MTHYQAVIKPIVLPAGKIIAETKSMVATSDNNQTEISQNVSVSTLSGNSSSSSSKSGYNFTSGSIPVSVSCSNE
jgi:hypothetical protein